MKPSVISVASPLPGPIRRTRSRDGVPSTAGSIRSTVASGGWRRVNGRSSREYAGHSAGAAAAPSPSGPAGGSAPDSGPMPRSSPDPPNRSSPPAARSTSAAIHAVVLSMSNSVASETVRIGVPAPGLDLYPPGASAPEPSGEAASRPPS